MTLLEIQTDLKRTNDLLERIAVALERAVGPVEEAEPGTVAEFRKTEAQHIGRVDLTGEKKTLDRLKKYGA